MSRSNQPPSDKLLFEAVELRIAGLKWEIVAEKLNRAFDTIRKWPMRYPDRWQAAIERAEQRLTIDSNAESVVVLRNMLRDDDIRMRWHAANGIGCSPSAPEAYAAIACTMLPTKLRSCGRRAVGEGAPSLHQTRTSLAASMSSTRNTSSARR